MKLTEFKCDYFTPDGEMVFHAAFDAATPQEACVRCAKLAREEQGLNLTWLVLASWEDGEWEYLVDNNGNWNKLGCSSNSNI